MHFLHTVPYTFPDVLTRRIFLTIKNLFRWWSFSLFSWPLSVIQGWYFVKRNQVTITLRAQMVRQQDWRRMGQGICYRCRIGSISVSGQLPTYPSPNPTLTLNCCQLTVVELGEGRWAVVQILILIHWINISVPQLVINDCCWVRGGEGG